MLPGVELARRRRLHHRHDSLLRGPPEPSAARPSSAAQLLSIDDPAASAARRRLEEKLHRPFGGSRSPSSLSPACSFPRWMRTSTASAQDNSSLAQSSPEGAAVLGSRNSGMGKRNGGLARRGSKTDICAVCLDGFGGQQQVTWLPCAHRYHSSCVLPWLADHSHCPYCRTEVPSLEFLSESAL